MPDLEQEVGQEVVTPEHGSELEVVAEEGIDEQSETPLVAEPTVDELQEKIAKLEHDYSSLKGREKKRDLRTELYGEKSVANPQAYQPQPVAPTQNSVEFEPESQQQLDQYFDRKIAPLMPAIDQWRQLNNIAQATARNKDDFSKLYPGVKLDEVAEEMEKQGYDNSQIAEVRLGAFTPVELADFANEIYRKKIAKEIVNPTKVAKMINNATNNSKPVLGKGTSQQTVRGLVEIVGEMTSEEQMTYFRNNPGSAAKYRELTKRKE